MTDGETTWDYTYDANGLRTERTDGTDTYRYVYDGDKLTFMARNGLYLRFAYTPEGTPLSVLYKGTTYYYVTNLQGDVTAILSQNGYVMVEYTYDAWGNLLTTTGSLANSLGKYNPLRYRGYVYDYETGLYYLQSRYYNPKTGRFLNADGLVATGQGLLGNNMFAYCENNPVNCFDPDGRCKKFLGFLWKIDCGSATCKQSKNYNSAPKKVAVLYDGRTSGWFGGLLGGVGFKSQGESLISSLQSQYAVEAYAFETIEDLVTGWNSLSGEYERIYILSHGYAGGLSCAGQSIGGPGLEDYSFWDLNSVSANSLYLYSCNGATVPEGGYSAAYYFSLLTGGNVHAVVNGSLGYRYGTHMPLPKGRGTWSVTYAGTTTFWN